MTTAESEAPQEPQLVSQYQISFPGWPNLTALR